MQGVRFGEIEMAELEKSAKNEKLGSSLVFQYMNSIVFNLSGIIFYVYIVKFYPTSVAGEIVNILAILGLFNIVFSLSLSNAATRFISYHIGRNEWAEAKSVMFKILFVTILSATAGSLLLFLISPYMSILFFHDTFYARTISYLSIPLFTQVIFGLINGIILGFQRFKVAATVNVTGTFLWYFLATVFLYMSNDVSFVPLGMATGYVIGIIPGILIIFSIVRKRSEKAYNMKINNVIHYAIPLIFASVISYGSSYIDRIFVSIFTDLSTLGVYGFALLMATGLAMVVTPITNILLPKVSAMFSRNDMDSIRSAFRLSTTVLTFVYVPCALGLAAISYRFIQIFATGSYVSGAVPAMIILSVTALLVSQNIMSQAVYAHGKTSIFIWIATFTLISNLTLSILLIPRYSMIGAAIANSSVYMVSFIVLYATSRKLGFLNYDMISMIKIWVSSIVVFIVVYYLGTVFPYGDLSLLELVVIGTVVYLLMVKLLRVIRKEYAEIILDNIPSNLRFINRLVRFISNV
jgi:O-antigen/teichoic acid export membrane protein